MALTGMLLHDSEHSTIPVSQATGKASEASSLRLPVLRGAQRREHEAHV